MTRRANKRAATRSENDIIVGSKQNRGAIEKPAAGNAGTVSIFALFLLMQSIRDDYTLCQGFLDNVDRECQLIIADD